MFISIKPFLVTSNGRGWWYKHCEKRLPLKYHSFRERSNFPRIWFRDLGFRTWCLEINHLNAHNFVKQGCFFSSRKFDDRLSSNFHRDVILCNVETPIVKASLWHSPIVSTAFKQRYEIGSRSPPKKSTGTPLLSRYNKTIGPRCMGWTCISSRANGTLGFAAVPLAP